MPAPAIRAPSLPPRRRSLRLRRFVQLWAAGAVAAVAVTGASAIGWLEPLQVRTLDLIQRLGGQRFPPEVVIVAIDDAAFETLGARQPIPRAYLARVLRGLDRSGAAVVGLDIALSVATAPEDDAPHRRRDRRSRREAGSRLPGGAGRRATARIGPLADPGLLGAVPRGSDRVPIDDDGVIRRVAVAGPAQPGREPVPAFALATLGQLGASRRGGAGAGSATTSPPIPYWRRAGLGAERRAAGRAPRGELWRDQLRRARRELPHDPERRPRRARRARRPARRGGQSASGPDRARRRARSRKAATSSRLPSAGWPVSRCTPTSCTCWRHRSLIRPAGWPPRSASSSASSAWPRCS